MYDRGYQALGEGEWKLFFYGHRASVWDDEKVLEMNTADGCTTQ